MAELLLLTGVIALVVLAFWLTIDSDDDNGGGGLMQPALVPIPVRAGRARR
ncbi:hypothetical protein [Cyanobium sp. Morenito 9A2]|uniref:hypothetical protein n=1 Tax=Cyanobium sp. Morenito 9A2 TaxID=2823718 RepID=UPI0020CD4755|nr:hypothetical protein [Cyanobium sp. Morenito 9A2]MCP9848436.1 hypothetical protein [Cyanobium sp. Morenito 9A2]